jgi:plasmid stabilization system protein ParE
VTDILWSPRAEADLKEIRAFIETDSPAWADLTVRRVVAAVERLREFPDSGRIVPERQSPELREIISGNFRIVYRRKPALTEIATVFRGARDFSSLGL